MKLFFLSILFSASSCTHAFLAGIRTATTRTHLSNGDLTLNLSLEEVSSEIKAALDGATTGVKGSLGDVSLGIKASLDGATNGVKGVVGNLDTFNSQIDNSYKESLEAILNEIRTILTQEGKVQTEFSEYATRLSQEIDRWLGNQNPDVESLYQRILHQITSFNLNSPGALVLSAIATYTIVSSILTWDEPPPPSKPYLQQQYDPIGAKIYFDGKPLKALSRGVEIALKSFGFALSLLLDKIRNKWEENQEKRGMELAELLNDLGPTFIKIGQSLSIRTDILSPAYIRGLATLQDKVPPFDTKIAKHILEDEWGQSVNSVLSKISDEPVAAASLGQVYKATMIDGREVAVKVQRPNIMEQIALDMHLIREFASITKSTIGLNTDTVGTVDAWGAGFVDELDYIQEAENGKFFTEKIKETSLKDVVFAPAVVDELTTTSVLVTEWIDGERLDKSSSEDITILCSICMNTYLSMLLELGLLQNPKRIHLALTLCFLKDLLRTPEGKLCILDWGMVTRLAPELQLTLIEHMAHLTSSDYAEVPRDLLLLDFIPKDKADSIEDSGIVEVLADIYGAWTSGGGVASINVNDVINRLQDLTAEKGNLFQIPPYFAYIAKSFSVLEGIGLSNDPKYSIINECLPYVSNRLLTDKKSLGPALQTFVFGPAKNDIETRIVDYNRVEQLIEGFGNFSTSSSGALLGKESLSRTQVLEEAADRVLDIVVTEEESPFQDILLEQLAKIVAANSRSFWAEVRERSGTLPSGRSLLGTIVDPLGLFRTSPLVNTSESDQKIVETTRKLILLLRNQVSASSSDGLVDLSSLQRDEVAELSAILARKVWDRRVSLIKTGNRFFTKLLEQTASRLENGERIRRPIATTRSDSSSHEPKNSRENSSLSFGASAVESKRLAAARNRLEELSQLEEGEEVVSS
eukprot:scaffold1426_cov83-Cylindrotheca_fusiformis.AAC.7